MRVRVFSELGWLEWEDGLVRGSENALAELLDATGDVNANRSWPSIVDPDVTKHMDFTVTAQAVLGPDSQLDGDLPHVSSLPPGAVA